MAAVLKHLQEKRRREQMGEEAKRQRQLEESRQEKQRVEAQESDHDSSSECCDSNCSGSSSSCSDDSQDSRLAELKPATPEICQKLVKSEMKPFNPTQQSHTYQPMHSMNILQTVNATTVPFEVINNHNNDSAEQPTPDLDEISIHSSDEIFNEPVRYNKTEKFIEEQSKRIDHTIMQVLEMAKDPKTTLNYEDGKDELAANSAVPMVPKLKILRPGRTAASRRRAPNGTRTHHPCPYCPKVFPSKAQFEKHERTHTGEKPYACSVCSATFGRKDRLRMHVRIHTGEKPHHCENCDSKFTTREQLVKHVKVHTGQKDYICSECDKRFAEKSDLKRHVLIHTDQRPFVCATCARTFKRKYSLQVHNRLHTGEKPYTCLTCDKAFHTSSHLSSHIQSNHL